MLRRTVGLLIAIAAAIAADATRLDDGALQKRHVTLAALRASQTGCQAVILEEEGEERSIPCGAATFVGGRTTRAFVQTADHITPFMVDVTRGGDFVVARFVRIARVTFALGRPLEDGERIRVVSLVEPFDDLLRRSVFIRDVRTDSSLSLPAGAAMAFRLDRHGRAAAYARFNATAGEDTLVSLLPPERDSAAIAAWLSVPARSASASVDVDELTITALDRQRERRPDAEVAGSNGVFAWWNGVEGAQARLLLRSTTLRLPNDTAPLTRGAITTIDTALAPLPALQVSIGHLPEGTRETVEELTLVVAPSATGTGAVSRRRLAVEPGESYTLAALPPTSVTVDLEIDGFILRNHADLSTGANAELRIELDPLTVSGTVRHDGAPARARLRFHQAERDLEVDTDPAGNYDIVLWQPRRYIITASLLTDPDRPPLTRSVSISGDTTLDIEIPSNAFHLHVHDAQDGTPIEGAEILVHNRWSDDQGQSGSTVTTVVSAKPPTALPPLQSGTVEIHVKARGYRTSNPIVLPVQSGDVRTIDVALARSAAVSALEVRLGHAPAAGAEIAVWTDGHLRISRADDQGFVQLPENLRGPVIIRHPQAASTMVLGIAGGGQLTLDPATHPLRVIPARDGARLRPPQSALLTIWLGGSVRLVGQSAAFATWSAEFLSAEGSWTLRGLGRGTVRILVTSGIAPQMIESGLFDSLATTVTYPWPDFVTVPIVDR